MSRFSSGVFCFALISLSACSDAGAPRSAPRVDFGEDSDPGVLENDTNSRSTTQNLDGKWEAAHQLDRADAALSISGDVAGIGTCATGDAIIVWSRIGDGTDIYASRFDAANGTWSPRTRINANNGLPAQSPALAVNAECDAIVVWHESEEQSRGREKSALVSATYTASVWKEPSTLLNAGTEQWIDHLEVSMNGIGDALITYRLGASTGPSSAMYQAFSKCHGFGMPAQISAGNITSAHAGMLSNGDVLYVYAETQVEGAEKGRYLARPANGEWSTPTSLAEGYTLDRVIASGNRFFATGKLGARTVMAMQLPGGSVELVPLDAPSEDIVAQGNRVVAHWVEQTSERGVLRATRYVAGRGFETAQTVSDDASDVSLADSPVLVLDSVGRATAIFKDERTQTVFASRAATQAWSTPHALNEGGTGLRAAVAADGSVFAAWTSGEPWALSVARFVHTN